MQHSISLPAGGTSIEFVSLKYRLQNLIPKLSQNPCLCAVLQLHIPTPPAGGTIGEFVNPKYKDATKTAFKSSTRLECMMQDYPKALPADAKVGFTVINQVRNGGQKAPGLRAPRDGWDLQ
jgi:hypothetical protein